jgi:CRISPR-associated exonuclease Cas4
MSEIPQTQFTITDLKQFVYCPRIFYYHTCLPGIRPVTYKMKAGIDAHEVEQKRAARRSMHMYGVPAGERHFDVDVSSADLGLSGLIDEVVETDTEMIPVDYKLAARVGKHFKLQLAAYGHLLADYTDKPIKRGFLYLIPKRQAVEVKLTRKLRQEVQAVLDQMGLIDQQEVMPKPTSWRQRCVDCEFRRLCNDV